MSRFRALLFLLVSLGQWQASAAIYGSDNRRDIERSPRQIQELSRSVLMMIPKTALQKQGEVTILDALPLSHELSWNVCSEDPHARQLSVQPACTGFLVAPDLLVTAGHCMIWMGEVEQKNQETITTPFCADFMWLTDFQTRQGQVETRLTEDRLVGCKNVLYAHSREIAPHQFQIDAAIIRLDRPLNDRPVLKISQTPVRRGEALSMLGYPNGLPQKWTDQGFVLTMDHPHFFRTSLDAMNGNSGSPVLNQKLEVVGILVRGYPEDYRYDEARTCRVLNRCDQQGAKCSEVSPIDRPGEHVQYIDVLRRFIQK